MSIAAGLIEAHYWALLQWCKLQQQKRDASDLPFQFDVEGVGFFCFYDAWTSPEHVCIRCDVFDLSGEREASLLKALLKDNCHRHQHGMPIFSMNVEEARVLTLWNMCLLTNTPSAFAAQVHRWVHDVKQWQQVSVSDVHKPQRQDAGWASGGRRAQ